MPNVKTPQSSHLEISAHFIYGNTTIANTAATTTTTNSESYNLDFYCLALFKSSWLSDRKKNTWKDK